MTTWLAVVIKQCGKDQQHHTLGLLLFKQLGGEYLDMLDSIITAEGVIANVVGMTQMNSPIKDLLASMYYPHSAQLTQESAGGVH